MHRLRLIKGLSYTGAVSATKEHPEVFVEDEEKYLSAMKSGYFAELSISGREAPQLEENVQEKGEVPEDFPQEEVSGFSEMTLEELKAYATVNGIDISGLKKKDDIAAAVKAAEERAAEARAALRAE